MALLAEETKIDERDYKLLEELCTEVLETAKEEAKALATSKPAPEEAALSSRANRTFLKENLLRHHIEHGKVFYLEKEGSGAIQLAHPKASGLVAIQSSSKSAGDVKMDNQQCVSLLIEQGTSVDSLEGKMEVAIVEAFRLEDNKMIQKLIKKKPSYIHYQLGQVQEL
ncbi:unnamed protein product [Cylindrotheca closterium]|uniref:Uncharacterized protein n=1 Tax=Cylindrotheca closterium TaxID=2856 RepID=A0AAD2CJA4_9STRA|nr:unnamed protein product [Cylindrotheca closterium]